MKSRAMLLLLLFIIVLQIPALSDTSIQPEAGDFPKDQAVRIATEQFLKDGGIDEKGLARLYSSG